MSEKKETFQDLMAEISHGDPLDLESEERVTPEDTPIETPDGEDEDKPVREPESEEERETEKDRKPKDDKPKDDGDPEQPEPRDDGEEPEETEAEDAEPVAEFEIDGEKVTLEQIREWKNNGLRQEDYSRKTMETSDLKKDLLKRRQDLNTLAQEIGEDKALQQFIAAHPSALGHLMANPEETRKLLGQPKLVEEFWQEYEVIKDNPRIAERLLSRPDEGEQELRMEQERQTMTRVVGTLDQFITTVGQEHYPEVDVDNIREFVSSLAGMPDDATHEQQVAAVGRLFQLFYRKGENGWTIDPKLIQSEFEKQKAAYGQPDVKDDDEEEVRAHNEKVDAQLNKEDAPPRTPDGAPPAASPEKTEYPESFRGVLDALQGG